MGQKKSTKVLLFRIIRMKLNDSIYTPPLGLSTLVKEFTAASGIMLSFSNELSILVSGTAKM